MAEAIDLTSPKAVATAALSCLDLTELGDAATEETTLALVDRAITDFGSVAAVCIWPRFVAAARTRLGPSSPVRIATVVNFPSGDLPVAEVVAETTRAVADGADEIDLVIPWKALIAGDEQAVRDVIRAVRAAAPAPVTLKTILETGELKDPALISRASDIALEEQADFIKTSTGKVAVNATLEAARIMLEVIQRSGTNVGFKPARRHPHGGGCASLFRALRGNPRRRLGVTCDVPVRRIRIAARHSRHARGPLAAATGQGETY